MKLCRCFSVSLICFTSCAELTEGLKRASARSAENNTPSNLQHLETAYLRRISDMAWASICHPTFTSEFWPRRDEMHARRCCTPNGLRYYYARIVKRSCDQGFRPDLLSLQSVLRTAGLLNGYYFQCAWKLNKPLKPPTSLQ